MLKIIIFKKPNCISARYGSVRVYLVSGIRPRLNHQTFPKKSRYAASAPLLHQLMSLLKTSVWRAWNPGEFSASLPLPALCAADAHWPSSLCLASCCFFSLSDSVCFWLTAPLGLPFPPGLLFKPVDQSDCIWCHLLLFLMNNTPTFFWWKKQDDDGCTGMTWTELMLFLTTQIHIHSISITGWSGCMSDCFNLMRCAWKSWGKIFPEVLAF